VWYWGSFGLSRAASGAFVLFAAAAVYSRGTKKKPERPRTSAEPIQKAPTHLPFFFFPDLFFRRKK
jgi:hypothetical protein